MGHSDSGLTGVIIGWVITWEITEQKGETEWKEIKSIIEGSK